MSRYLDPKSDIVFKKIFGQRPDLLKSFLNAVLPLPEDGLIVSLEYLSNEQVPVIPLFKYTVVDVKCTDQQGRVFIVEMQIEQTPYFMQRMLFNASKAYVRQLEKGEDYELLKPVYGLALMAGEFDKESEDWYHHYKIVNVKKPEREIKDLQLVFIELKKFKAKTMREKRLQVLWLRFLSELDEHMNRVPEEWLEVPEIRLAVELAEEAAFTPGELDTYEKFWDAVRIEKTREKLNAKLVDESYEKGIQQGMERGIEQGIEQGIERGKWEEKHTLAKKLFAEGMPVEQIARITGLSLETLHLLFKPISV